MGPGIACLFAMEAQGSGTTRRVCDTKTLVAVACGQSRFELPRVVTGGIQETVTIASQIPVLSASSINKSFNALVVLNQVNFVVGEREAVGIVGPNGAGKTTLLNAICGALRPASGNILFGETNITGEPAYRVARRGILLVPEGRQILGPLTVRENLELGRLALGSRRGGRRPSLGAVFDLFPRLAERVEQIAGSLSGGEQQMLAIGRALMGAPELLLLDEPSLGLAPIVVAAVFDALKRLNSSGLTILLVEQNARGALEIADYAYVMERGRIVDEGESSGLRTDPNIQSHYLGVALSLTPTAGGSAP